MPKTTKKYPEHLKYAVDVLNGKHIVGKLIKLQCEISLKNYDKPPKDWAFDAESAEAAISFLECCPFVEGHKAVTDPETGTRAKIELLDWMKYFVGEIYGWWSADGTGVRRYNSSFCQIGKKNAKSTIGAGICLYETFFGDPGSQVYSAATQLEQALYSWNHARNMMEFLGEEELSDIKARVTNTHIWNDDNHSYFTALTRKQGKSIHGHSPSFVLLDEAALCTDSEVVRALRDSFGGRLSGHMMRITTAAPYANTVWQDDRRRVIEKLKKKQLDSRDFALFYEIDTDEDGKGDDPKLEKNWPKANPGLGNVKSLLEMRSLYDEAQASDEALNSFLLFQMNVYTGVSENQWLDTKHWVNLPKWKPEDPYPYYRRTVGVDMSSSEDLTAVCFRYENPGSKTAILRFKCFATEGSLEKIPLKDRDTIVKLYRNAEETGLLDIEKGELLDYEKIDQFLRDEYKDFPWEHLGYDPAHHRTSMFTKMLEDGMPIAEVLHTRIGPTTAIVASRLRAGLYSVIPSDFLQWQFQNCRKRVNSKEQELIAHYENKPYLKQDALTALVIAERVHDDTLMDDAEPQFLIAKL